jgi:hypothetical protein
VFRSTDILPKQVSYQPQTTAQEIKNTNVQMQA